VTRKTYGLIAGLVGAGFGAWWWRARRAVSSLSGGSKGTVIYENTPAASTPDGNL
jgi:hypothetical protein